MCFRALLDYHLNCLYFNEIWLFDFHAVIFLFLNQLKVKTVFRNPHLLWQQLIFQHGCSCPNSALGIIGCLAYNHQTAKWCLIIRSCILEQKYVELRWVTLAIVLKSTSDIWIVFIWLLPWPQGWSIIAPSIHPMSNESLQHTLN